MMNNNWEKREKTNKMKALTVAVLVHALFIMSLMSLSSAGDDGGVADWFKSKFQKENIEQAEVTARS